MIIMYKGANHEIERENNKKEIIMNHFKKIISNVSLIMLIITMFIIVTAPAECFGQDARETWQPPERIMDAIGVSSGMKIGEAGAGRGYFTFPLARRVGPRGIVFANDISNSSLTDIRERALREDLKNIRIVVGEVEDPLFPEKNLDMVIMVYVLHEVERPIPFLKNIHSYLKPGGLLVIIERNTNEDRSHFPSFMSKKQILETVDKTEYELDRIESFLTYDNIYIYKTLTTTGQ
jgi:ubiquinone/menaquinone biosynthesis C-methylase UbiE